MFSVEMLLSLYLIPPWVLASKSRNAGKMRYGITFRLLITLMMLIMVIMVIIVIIVIMVSHNNNK